MPKERDDSYERLERRSRRDDRSVDRYRSRRRSWSYSSSNGSSSVIISRDELVRLQRLADNSNRNERKSKDRRSQSRSNYSHHRRGSPRSSSRDARGPMPSIPVKKCHYCESYDHLRNQCPLQGIKRCYGCAELGHTRPKCPLPLSQQRGFGWQGGKKIPEEIQVEGTRRTATDDLDRDKRENVWLKEIETRRNISPQRTTNEQQGDKRMKLEEDDYRMPEPEDLAKRRKELEERQRVLLKEARELELERAQSKRDYETQIQKKEAELRIAQTTVMQLKQELERLKIEYEKYRTPWIEEEIFKKSDEKFLPRKKSPIRANQSIVSSPPMRRSPETIHIASEDQWAYHVLNFVKNT